MLENILPESIWFEIKSEPNKFLVCYLYRPPQTAVEIWDRINVCIDKALEVSNNIILVGDINEDQLNVTNNKFRDILLLNNMKNVINEPTRVTPYSSTLLDPIAMSNNITCLHSGIFETDKRISDHIGTFSFIKIIISSSSTFKRRVWNYKRADFSSLNNKIQSTDWSFLNVDDLNTSVVNFTNTFLDLAKLCIPNTFATIRPSDRPWYNSDIRKISRKRDRLRKKQNLLITFQTGQILEKLETKLTI